MKIRSTARATARERRQHQRRASQSVALGLMVAGLVLGAFAAPSLAAEGDLGGSVSETTAGGAGAPVSTIDDLDLDPGGSGEGAGGTGGSTGEPGPTPDDCGPLGGDKESDISGCQPLPCNATGATNCPTVPLPCTSGVDYNGDADGCGTPNGTQCLPMDYNGDAPGCGTAPPPTTVEPCTTGIDYNGPTQDGCGTAPGGGTPGGGTPGGGTPGGGTPGGGTPGGGTPGTGSGGSNGGNGSGGGSAPGGNSGGASAGGSLGTTLGQAEGTVPGAEVAAQVTACGDSVICQSAPAATPATTSSTSGLPQTGAAENSRQLLGLGLGLLVAGGLLLAPRRGGRHRLVRARA